MNYLWNIEIQDIKEAQELARSRGKKEGDSYEVEFLEIMKKKGKKPCGATELTKEELLNEYTSKGKSVLDISVDKEGKQVIKIIQSNNEN